MDCIREAENYLRYLRELHTSIKHADRMINKLMLETAPKMPGAVSIEPTGVHGGKVVNSLNQIYQLQKWQEMKQITLDKIAEVNESLDEICGEPGCERYREILELWYVHKKDKDEIAEKMGYSSRQSVYDMKKKAITKFAISLFGVTALEAV